MLVPGTIASLATFVLFDLMTVFALSWGTGALGYSRPTFLILQLCAVIFFGLTIRLLSVLADRYARAKTLMWVQRFRISIDAYTALPHIGGSC